MVKGFLQLPLVRQLHVRGLLFPTLALLAVGGVLVQGALHKPTPETAQPLTKQEPLSLPLTRPTLGKTPLNYFSEYWLQVAQESRHGLLLIGQDKTPAIVVAPGVAVSSIAAAEDVFAMEILEQLRESLDNEQDLPADPALIQADSAPEADLSADERQGRNRVLGIVADMGLALFEIPRPYAAIALERADPGNVESGSYAAAVSLSPEGELRIAPGVAVSRPPSGSSSGSYSFDVSIPFPDHTGVAAIVDLDGALLAVAVASGPSVQVLSTDAIQGAIERVRNDSPCQAFEATDMSSDVRDILRMQQGIVIERVRDVLSAKPAIHPGDVLLEWAGKPVGTAVEFQQLYQVQEPGATVSYALQRGGRRLQGKAQMPDAGCRPPTESMVPFARLGLVVQWQSRADDEQPATREGWMVLGVLEGGPAAAGGLKRGDWITAVQERPLRTRERQPFERYESQPQPMVLEVQRGERVLLLAIQRPEDNASTPNPASAQP